MWVNIGQKLIKIIKRIKNMKITKQIKDNLTTYFYDGVKKYRYYKDSDGLEWWKEYDKQGNGIHYKYSDGYEYWIEYDKQGNEIHYKDSNDYEWWSDDNPNNPKNKSLEVKEEDIKPFTFKNLTK